MVANGDIAPKGDAMDGYGVLFIRCCVSRSQATNIIDTRNNL